MKKPVRIFAFIFLGLLVVAGLLVSYVKFLLPDIDKPADLKVERTPARIERGKYLANHVTVCIDCHSKRDWTTFAAPLDPASIGSGGEKFDHGIGFPGEVYVPNITPYNLGSWSDGELYRAITSGVKKDGSAIFPIMPYKYYGKMSNEDIYSIIAYIRTLPEKQTTQRPRKLDFPLNIIVNTMPEKAQPTEVPPASDQLEYGAYLVNAAGCKECHTPAKNGSAIAGMEFAGGYDFSLPSGKVSSANITPDLKTGIGGWSKEQFVARFKMYADTLKKPAKVGPKDFQTVMPWMMYSGMSTSDLEAMYAYLKSVKPIQNKVNKFAMINKL